MNFYTVAAKIHKAANKYALENEHTHIHTNYKEAYEYELENQMITHEKVMNIGIKLLENYKEKVGRVGRQYMITIRPSENTIEFKQFQKDVQKYLENTENFEYAFEQKGECEDEMGKGFHVHIIIRGTTEQHYPSKLLRNAQRLFSYVAANCIQVDTLKNIERACQYIRGDKNNTQKNKACEIDKLWRAHTNIPDIVASGQVHPLAIN